MVAITQNVMDRGNHRDFQTKYQLANAPLALNIKPAFQSDWDSCNELFQWNESPGGTAEHRTKMFRCNIWLMLQLKQTWNEAVSWRQSLKQLQVSSSSLESLMFLEFIFFTSPPVVSPCIFFHTEQASILAHSRPRQQLPEAMFHITDSSLLQEFEEEGIKSAMNTPAGRQ